VVDTAKRRVPTLEEVATAAPVPLDEDPELVDDRPF
jgi:hypothetical protein